MIGDISTLAQSTPQIPVPPGGKLGKDEFLKMLVAQLKNQDPMNPMKGDDMAAQLAQFSSLEQLTNIGKTLESQNAAQGSIIASINDTAAMNMIGKSILATGDQVEVDETGAGRFQVDVGGAGGLATLRIFNEAGVQVGTRPLGFVKTGRHEFELGSAAEGLAPGGYRYAVDVVDAAGKPVPSQPFVIARIDGVRYGTTGPVMTAGDLRIPFGTILQISD